MGEIDLDKKKLNRFQHVCRTIRRHLKKTSTEAQTKLYKVAARPTLLYGSETWITTKREDSRITAAEMRFLRAVQQGYRIRNSRIRDELQTLGIDSVRDKYKRNWIDHGGLKTPKICPEL